MRPALPVKSIGEIGPITAGDSANAYGRKGVKRSGCQRSTVNGQPFLPVPERSAAKSKGQCHNPFLESLSPIHPIANSNACLANEVVESPNSIGGPDVTTLSQRERTAGTAQGVILLLPVTLSVMGIAVIIPVLPQLMQQFAAVPNHQYLIQGGVLTMPALCATVFSPFAGWMSDRFGRRLLLLISMGAYAMFGAAPLLLDDLFAIIATRIGVGICEAIILTVTTTLLSDHFSGHEREKWLASQTAVASISALALIYVGGLLGSVLGWRGPFAVYLVSLVLLVGVYYLTWEPHPADGIPSAHSPTRTPFPWPRMTGICVITLLASIMFYTIQTQSSLALSALGVHEPSRLGTLTALASLGVPIGTLVFRAVRRVSIGLLLCGDFAIIATGFVWMGKAVSAESFVAAATLNQIGCGMILPTLLTWAVCGLAFDVRGRGTGVWQGTFSVGQFVSGVVITFVAERAGGLLPAFVMLGTAALIAALLALAGHSQRRVLTQFVTGVPFGAGQ